jgi:hypothetical protein
VKPNDRPLFYALVAIVFGLILNAVVGASPECEATPRIQTTNSVQDNENSESITHQVAVFAYAPFCAAGSSIVAHKDVIDGFSTFIMAAFTMILAWSTVRLWRETERLAHGADEQSKKMTDSIAAMNSVAVETAKLVAESAKQVTEMHGLAEAAKKSADLSEQSITRIERPYLFISAQHTALYIDPKFRIEIMCTNHGRTPAVLKRVQAQIFKKVGEPPEAPYRFDSFGNQSIQWMLHGPLGISEKMEHISYDVSECAWITTSVYKENKPDRMTVELAEGERCFFVVAAEYLDTSGNEHVTWNCWEYFRKKAVFLRVDKPECHKMT